MKKILEGSYDLHIHSAPDVLPRKMDDFEMAERAIEAGMKGFALKSHYFCTSERAQLVMKKYPNLDVVGTIALNNSVGGINPSAVEMAGRSGARLVWFPTCDGKHEQEHVFKDKENKKLPYWASIVIKMKEEGIHSPPITILDDKGNLTEDTLKVLNIIKKYNMILATGHLSHEETFKLVEEANKKGIDKILITHADFPTTFYNIEDQKKLVKLGATIEHTYTTWKTDKIEIEVVIEQIKSIGPENVVLATDLGQSTAKYPDEGLLEFANLLLANGFTYEEVKMMLTENNYKLLK